MSSWVTRLGVAVLFLVASHAEAATWFVADTGADGGGCGTLAKTPCRSISQAIANAIDGDTISVAPGRYGDLNRNSVLGEPGEENGSAGCSCVLLVDKAVVVVSSAGAAVTIIDGRTVAATRNVIIAADGARFGQPGRGFTVTSTPYQLSLSDGIVIAANGVTVGGNQVLFVHRVQGTNVVSEGMGIHTGNQLHSVRIEGNLVIGWAFGIDGGPGITVSKNQVVDNRRGIVANGGDVIGNVAVNNLRGFELTGAAVVTGNAAYANLSYGFSVTAPFVGVFTKNNMFGNNILTSTPCGLFNLSVAGLAATNNYWGAPTGPGDGTADTVCNNAGGTTHVTPFAKKPFAVRILKP